jgi:hypothetical protein
MSPKRKRPKRTPEERAAERARREDLTRRLQEMIEWYRKINADRRHGPGPEAS